MPRSPAVLLALPALLSPPADAGETGSSSEPGLEALTFSMSAGAQDQGEDASVRTVGGEETRGLFGPAAPIDEPLVTDRPDFTESAVTVPRGRVQIESGFTYTYDDEDEIVETWTLPETLVRIGLADDFELRIGAPNYAAFDSTGAGFEDGATDLSLGFKHTFTRQEEGVPAFGLIGGLTLPTGSDEFTTDTVDPFVILAASYAFENGLSIAGNVGFFLLEEPADDDRFLETTASVALGAPITDEIGAYVEYFGLFRSGAGLAPSNNVNAGLTFLVNPNLQFDVRVGAGLNDSADDFFTGAGVSFRF